MSCRRTILAAGDACIVGQCSCGHVHLDFGSVTLRIESSAVGSLAETFAVAARSIRGVAPERPLPRDLH